MQTSSSIFNAVVVELTENDDLSNLSNCFGNMSSPSKVKSIEASSLYRTSSIQLARCDSFDDDTIMDSSSNSSSSSPFVQASIGGNSLKRTFHIKGTISKTHAHMHTFTHQTFSYFGL
jgi:hypothetical protein